MKKLTLGSLFSGSGGFEVAGILSGIEPIWNSEVLPFAKRVTTKRLPQVKHYGDISKLNGADLPPVDIITFGSPCFPEGTLVLTELGYIPIEDVNVGTKVLTHKGRWRTVTAAGAKIGKTVVLKGNHYGLECTPNHPIYCSGEKRYYPRLENGKRGNRLILTDKKWIPAENMQGKLWAIPNYVESLPISSPIYSGSWRQKTMPPISEDFFYFVGRWLGDGWVCNGQRSGRPAGETYGKIFICDSEDKADELDRIVRRMSEKYTVSQSRGVVRFSFVSQVFAEWLTDNFGKFAYGKTMPGWVFGLPSEYRQSIINGLVDSDGYRLSSNSWRISTISKQLAQSIRLLAEIQGYSTTIQKTEVAKTKIIEGRTVNQHDYYSVVITKYDHHTDELHAWYRVRSVKPTERTVVVYNLTVDEDNSYIADGIVVHNCQSVSIAGRRDGIKHTAHGDDTTTRSGLFFEAIRIIKEMRCATNDQYPRYIVFENVSGLYSSSGGEDFRTVLEEICSIKEADVHIPRPAKKWHYAGEIVGDGYSVAWRTLDAQYFNVPQRRVRCFLVGSFGGASAGKILFESEGLSGYSEACRSERQRTAAAAQNSSGTAGTENVTVINDQGGERIDVTENMTATLRAQAHHPPVVMEAAGFCTEHSAKARSVGYEKEIAPTLRAGTVPAALSCFSNHSQDTRYTGPEEISQTISSTFGQGGNNQPFVVESRAYGICSTQSNAMKSDNPKSGFYEADTSRTLDTGTQSPNCGQGGMAVVQPIKNYDVRLTTEGTKNARSNVYETELARTIDTGGIAPNANQGGIAVVAVQGSMIGRKDENGPQGSGVNEDVSFSLTSCDRHAVAYGIDRAAFNQGQNALYNIAVEEEIEPTIVAKGPGAVAQPTYCTSKNSYHTKANVELAGTLVESDYKDPPVVNDTDGIEYIVRRLTPSECAVLQGYDRDWCSNLGTENPTAEDIEYWREVFNEYNHAIGKNVKPKSDNQIIKWLKDPHSDSAEYSLWGNGLCKWCAVFVLSGIAYFDAHEEESE